MNGCVVVVVVVVVVRGRGDGVDVRCIGVCFLFSVSIVVSLLSGFVLFTCVCVLGLLCCVVLCCTGVYYTVWEMGELEDSPVELSSLSSAWRTVQPPAELCKVK